MDVWEDFDDADSSVASNWDAEVSGKPGYIDDDGTLVVGGFVPLSLAAMAALLATFPRGAFLALVKLVDRLESGTAAEPEASDDAR